MSEYTLYLGAAFLLGASILTTQFLFNETSADQSRAQAEFFQQHENYASGVSYRPVQD
jgi:hypothetical protein